mmetsp:Transcript_13501/g.25752  ORF Transcript_13501/g.25752 Transcript_13501/m.25752 type:complete len:192 (+) Transcript_13501:71-646(+)
MKLSLEILSVNNAAAAAAASTPPTVASRTPSPRHFVSRRPRSSPPTPRVQTPARHQRKVPPTPDRSKPRTVTKTSQKAVPTETSSSPTPKVTTPQDGHKDVVDHEGLDDLLASERSEEEHNVAKIVTQENNPQEEEIVFGHSIHDYDDHDDDEDDQAKEVTAEPVEEEDEGLDDDLDDLLATDRSEDDDAV